MLGAERARAMRDHQLVVDHGADRRVGQLFDLADLMAGAETIEEVQEGHARLQRGSLGDQRQVHDFLRIVGAEHGPAGRARGHHIAVVAEDGERMGCQRARRDVEYRRGQLAGNLVHVGDHQQEALRGREGGGQRAGLQRTMHRARRATLRLHLDHQGRRAPDVLPALGAPRVGPFAHVAGRGDRVDGDHLVRLVRDIGRRLVAIDRDVVSFGHPFPPIE